MGITKQNLLQVGLYLLFAASVPALKACCLLPATASYPYHRRSRDCSPLSHAQPPMPLLCPQAEAIGARYAANWSAKHTTAAVANVAGGGGGGGGKPGSAAPPLNPLLAGTKLDPFAANGTGVRPF